MWHDIAIRLLQSLLPIEADDDNRLMAVHLAA